MKTIKTLALFLGLSLGIASCSKEGQDSPVLVERQVEGASKHVGSKDSVLVSFTIGADTEELRLAQSLNADGVPVSPFMEEKDVVIRFAVRKSGRVTYTDAVCKKVPGENKVTYKGIIRLPDLGYGNTPPTNLTGHEIAGILLGEANNGTQFVEQVDANTVKSIEQTELLTAEDNVVRSKVPYLLDWQSFPLTAQGVQQSKLQLTFKPVGNLLRIQFNNQLNETKTLQSIEVSSNAFVTQAEFDFTGLGSLRQKNEQSGFSLLSGSPQVVLNSEFRTEKNYELSNPVIVEPQKKSKWYYLWVMPLRHTDNDIAFSKVTTRIVGKTTDKSEYDLFNLCNALLEGSNQLTVSFDGRGASTLETAFKGGKLPLWYVAEYDVASGGRRLANQHKLEIKNNQRIFGYYRLSELNRIDVPGYYIPKSEEAAILGQAFAGGNGSGDWERYMGKNDIIRVLENVMMPGEQNAKLLSSIYHYTEENITYALRFSGCDNTQLTAYRYQAENTDYLPSYYNGDDIDYSILQNGRIRISSMYLGTGFTGDIYTISNPDFWASSPYVSTLVERIFPMHPVHVQDGTGIFNLFLFDDDFSRTKVVNYRIIPWRTESTVIEFVNQDRTSATVIERNVDNHQYPVRLFKNEYKTAR